jgi:membrane protein YdbS with pleckstrin-like domain
MKARIGEDFRPAPQFRTLNYIYTLAAFVFGFLSWQVPLLMFAPVHVNTIVGLFISLPILIIFLFTVYWIPKYYKSMNYKLTKDEMTWRRGVWFKNTGIVPYNRITNVDITQGPVSRSLGIAALKIQTAGYSGQTTRTSEIRIEGVREFEEMREFIMEIVRGRKPVAMETYETGETDVLRELVKIRKLLEKR